MVGKVHCSHPRIQYEVESHTARAKQLSAETEITLQRAGMTPRWRHTALPSYSLMGLSIQLLWIKITLSVSARRDISTKVQSISLLKQRLIIWWEMETLPKITHDKLTFDTVHTVHTYSWGCCFLQLNREPYIYMYDIYTVYTHIHMFIHIYVNFYWKSMHILHCSKQPFVPTLNYKTHTMLKYWIC